MVLLGSTTQGENYYVGAIQLNMHLQLIVERVIGLTAGGVPQMLLLLFRYAGFMRICDRGIIRIFPKSVHIAYFSV